MGAEAGATLQEGFSLPLQMPPELFLAEPVQQ